MKTREEVEDILKRVNLMICHCFDGTFEINLADTADKMTIIAFSEEEFNTFTKWYPERNIIMANSTQQEAVESLEGEIFHYWGDGGGYE